MDDRERHVDAVATPEITETLSETGRSIEPTLGQRITELIQHIPRGKVASYGQIAAAAGNPRAARLVVRVLRSRSDEYHLPWHRVINSQGTISLPRGDGFEIQRALLLDEGVSVDADGRIDLSIYGV